MKHARRIIWLVVPASVATFVAVFWAARPPAGVNSSERAPLPARVGEGSQALRPGGPLTEPWTSVEGPGWSDADRRPGAGAGLRAFAHELSADDPDLAISVLASTLLAAPNDRERTECSRMLGQLLMDSGKIEEAVEAFERAWGIFESDPSLIERYPVSYASVANQLSLLLRRLGRVEDALRVNDGVLAPGRRFADHSVAAALLHRSQMLAQIGRTGDAALTLDELFARLPNYGAGDGSGVRARLRLAELRDPSRASPTFIQTVREAWEDSRYRDHHESLTAGETLAEALNRSGRMQESLETYRRVADLADDWLGGHRDARLTDPARARIRSVRGSALAVLSSADAYGRFDLALDALTRLRALATDPIARQSCDTMEAHLRRRAAAAGVSLP